MLNANVLQNNENKEENIRKLNFYILILTHVYIN